MKVDLLDYEVDHGLYVAARRRAESIKQKLNLHKQGVHGKDPFDLDVIGAFGEMAVAKALDRYWSGSVNRYHGSPDIGHNIQVRSTTLVGNRLLVRKNDPDDHFFFLVYVDPPSCDVVGWIPASEVKKRSDWLDDPNGRGEAFFVPADALNAVKPRE